MNHHQATDRLRRAAAGVGLCLSQVPAEHARRVAHLAPLAFEVAGLILRGREPDGGHRVPVVLVTGPSGSGKSTFLRLLASELRQREPTPRVSRLNPEGSLARSKLALASMDDGPLNAWLAHLSRMGLGEARLWLSRPGALSGGQRFRLALALATRSAAAPVNEASSRAGADRRPRVLIADEFAATLDRFTAKALALSLSKLSAPQPGLCLVLATSHDDLLGPLAPEVLVRVGIDGRACVRPLVRAGLPACA